MKFNAFDLAATLLALPAVVAGCELKVQWTTNWSEAGLRRYQVKLITTPRNDDHLRIYCDAFRGTPAGNTQCFWDFDGGYKLDSSFGEGDIGHGYYLTAHNEAASTYRRQTGCNAVLDI